MARLTFQNVPTKSGGVVSGNISTGAGSPFGSGGKYEAQVANIQSVIASAPEGTYDPQNWEQFLEVDPVEFPEGLSSQFVPSDDPVLLAELYKIPQARQAMEGLANMRPFNHRWSQDQRRAEVAKRENYTSEIALHVNRLMKKYNAPLLKEVEDKKRQLEIDKAVQLAMEQKIRETATLTPLSMTPIPISTDRSWSNYAILGIAVVGFLLFLRSRA